MKKLFSILAITAMVFAGTFSAKATASPIILSNANTVVTTTAVTALQDEEGAVAEEESRGFHQELKDRFVEGGPAFMGIVLLCLILGLAFAIERIIYLYLSTTNTQKLADDVEEALNSGGVE